MTEKERKKRTLTGVGLSGAQSEVVQRYGSAVKEHIVAFSGVDNETGQRLAKSLDSISKSKINPETSYSNIKQQAGFSAEVETVARENAERIIRGETISRITRTDDMVKQPDGRGATVGGVNEPLYDLAQVDQNGVYIENTGRQLKYVGGTPKECAEKLWENSFDKYREHDVPVEVPSDFYEGVYADLSERIEKYTEQLEKARASGDPKRIEAAQKRLQRARATQQNLKKGKLTNAEAIEARLHPKEMTRQQINEISHRAGIEGLKTGAIIGGGISFVQNAVAVIKGDKKPADAVLAVAGDTTSAAVVSYATSFIGSAAKGAMQNAPSEYLRTLSKTSLPSTIVVSAIEVGKTLSRFMEGTIDGTQCLIELGEKGTGMLASSAGAVIGQAVVPIPIIGALVGSMAGYALSSAYYISVVDALSNAKLAHEDRLIIEAECRECIMAIREYRLQIELVIHNYLQESVAVFSAAFSEMDEAYSLKDADRFITSSNRISEHLGGKPIFSSKSEFDELIQKQEIITI